MTLLYHLTHPAVASTHGAVLERQGVCGIARRGDDVLLMHTSRFDDYSLPGCSLNGNETAEEALLRELRDEVGVADIQIGRYLGHGDTYSPPHKPGYDVLMQRCHFYLCQGQLLGKIRPGSYDLVYGVSAQWVNIGDAIRHNEVLLAEKPSHMDLLIQRDIRMLRYVLEHGLTFED